MQVNVHQAKTQLSKLLHQAEAGEDVVIARDGKPVARLVAIPPERPAKRTFGQDRGRIWIAPDFDDTPPEILAALDEDVFPSFSR